MRYSIEVPTNHNRAYLDEMSSELAYEAVRQSPLFNKCANAVVDAKADELASELSRLIDSWIEKETGDTFPVKGSELRSLSESESERSEAA